MKSTSNWLYMLLLTLCLSWPLRAGPIRLCNSTEFWPPYSFLHKDKLIGEHTEILDAAFADIGREYEQVLLPWKRCQDRVAAGELMGIIGISFTEERNGLFHFPADAPEDAPPDAISQVEFVIVTRADIPAPTSISIEAVPEPVGVLLGYRSADTVREAGKRAQIVAQQSSLFQMLERSRIASAVVLRGTAVRYVETSEEPLVIHEPALWSTPHFVAFSRKAGLQEGQMAEIWAAIKAVRADKARMAALRQRVNEMLEPCFAADASCK
ncbi:substrate-binding periplasmic protein [Kordiimonas aestuarii]|uniref:substrate-binding periplasmic protein n=1 Tax=Kordiimonas aestuarii TaxID=1005925 RepID=UPI0021D0BAD5|nr:transporter substrate-binding domain-containing protein [Kordiimonas aestuarii]